VNASPQAVFDIVSDVTRHPELAGSQEIKTVKKTADGPLGPGNKIFAEETVRVGNDSMDLTAESIVVTCDPPKSFSFITNPALPESVRRIQWWSGLSPAGQGTKVTHELEVE